MEQKNIIIGIIAVVAILGIVGYTQGWFTSDESILINNNWYFDGDSNNIMNFLDDDVCQISGTVPISGGLWGISGGYKSITIGSTIYYYQIVWEEFHHYKLYLCQSGGTCYVFDTLPDVTI